MNNDSWRMSILKIIDRLEHQMYIQREVDNTYSNLISCIFAELEKADLRKNVINKKKFKYYKDYWTDDLTKLWKNMKDCESDFIHCKGNYKLKNKLKRKFIDSRKLFDKTLRKSKKQADTEKILKLEEVNTSNPKVFWETLNRLGPQRKHDIPLKFIDDNGELNCDIQSVSNYWRTEFEKVYNPGIDHYTSFIMNGLYFTKAFSQKTTFFCIGILLTL